MNRPLFLLGLLVLFLAHPCLGKAVPDIALRVWNTTDGLPSNEVTYLFQDREGYLWVGMTNGLARFDGSHFERLPLPAPSPLSPLGVNAILEESDGALLVAPRFGGLLRLRDSRFGSVKLPAGLEQTPISTLMRDREDALWAGMPGGFLLRLGKGETRIFSEKDGFNPNFAPTTALDDEGRVWICCGELLAKFDGTQLVPFPIHESGFEMRIASANRGGPWVVTSDRLLKIDRGLAREIATLPPTMGAHYIQTMREDTDGSLWVGTRSRGLFRIVPGQTPTSISSHDDIYTLTHDRDGNLWVGANGGGLTRIRKGMLRCFDKTEGLPENFSMTVCEDSTGTIWLANRDGGLACISNDTVDVLPKPPDWRPFGVKALSPNPQGGVWVTSSHGLLKVSRLPETKWERMPSLPHLGTVRAAFTAKNGDLWLAIDPDKVARFREGVLTMFGAEQGFSGRFVRSIAEDRDGRIWIGTANAMLFRQKGDVFERVQLDTTVLLGAIQSLYFEENGALWLGSERNGLFKLDGQGLKNLDTNAGLPESNIAQIIGDGLGSLWLGSSSAIFHLSLSEIDKCLRGEIERVHPIVLGKDEGLKEVTCLGYFQPNVLRAKNGLLWFATRQGTIAIDPARDQGSTTPLKVRINAVFCDDKPLPPARHLHFKSSVSKVEIRYSALCLSTPDRVRTSYRLDGFDSDWVGAGKTDTAKYPKLPPGTYRFRVMASIGDTGDPASVDSIELVVEPLWWQTVWFQLGLMLLAGAGIAIVVRVWSHKRLRRRVAKLEKEKAIEAERIRIARNIHDDLGANLTRISLLTQAAGNNGLDAAQLEKVYATVTETTRAMDEIVWAVNPKYDDLESLAYYLTNYAPNFLNVAGIRCRLDMPEQIPQARLTSQTRHHLFLACREALNNVVKHSGATEVLLALRIEGSTEHDSRLVLSITDNGRGPKGSDREPARPGSGNGLNNMRSRMEELGGFFSIHPGPEGGTTVTLSIPLSNPLSDSKT